MPEFRDHLRKTITFFGAESVGKTTLSRQVARFLDSRWTLEYARPYLETVGEEITVDKMTDIWYGQQALQVKALSEESASPFIVQDTDLYSTVGYWEMWKPESVPVGLRATARAYRSDLYNILAQDGVPFEADPLRYGGDKRESTDQYWIDLCEREGLNYVVVDGDFTQRHAKCVELAFQTFFTDEVKSLITYNREFN
jgi:nicotinamide riboside kinase